MKGDGNSYDYGFRIYDPRLGRFLSVDPLTKSYQWYTPYQFAGNRPIVAIDLDGLEEYYTQSGEKIGKYGTSTEIRVVDKKYTQLAKSVVSDPSTPAAEALNSKLYNAGSAGTFNHPDDAAENWGNRYNGASIQENKEYNSDIYEVQINGETKYTYATPDVGSENGSGNRNEDYRNGKAPEEAEVSGNIHSHSAYSNGQYKDNIYSPNDKNTAAETGETSYLTTPNGSLKRYDSKTPDTGYTKGLSTQMPSDPKDPSRKNCNPPHFDWHYESKQSDRLVFKLVIEGNEDVIQGLVSLSIEEDHVYMHPNDANQDVE